MGRQCASCFLAGNGQAPPHEQPLQVSERSRQPPPELPQLWAEQPRYMTPNTPLSASTGRSITPSSALSGGRMRALQPLGGTALRPPLRRMESDPGLQKGYIDPSLR